MASAARPALHVGLREQRGRLAAIASSSESRRSVVMACSSCPPSAGRDGRASSRAPGRSISHCACAVSRCRAPVFAACSDSGLSAADSSSSFAQARVDDPEDAVRLRVLASSLSAASAHSIASARAVLPGVEAGQFRPNLGRSRVERRRLLVGLHGRVDVTLGFEVSAADKVVVRAPLRRGAPPSARGGRRSCARGSAAGATARGQRHAENRAAGEGMKVHRFDCSTKGCRQSQIGNCPIAVLV